MFLGDCWWRWPESTLRNRLQRKWKSNIIPLIFRCDVDDGRGHFHRAVSTTSRSRTYITTASCSVLLGPDEVRLRFWWKVQNHNFSIDFILSLVLLRARMPVWNFQSNWIESKHCCRFTWVGRLFTMQMSTPNDLCAVLHSLLAVATQTAKPFSFICFAFYVSSGWRRDDGAKAYMVRATLLLSNPC